MCCKALCIENRNHSNLLSFGPHDMSVLIEQTEHKNRHNAHVTVTPTLALIATEGRCQKLKGSPKSNRAHKTEHDAFKKGTGKCKQTTLIPTIHAKTIKLCKLFTEPDGLLG